MSTTTTAAPVVYLPSATSPWFSQGGHVSRVAFHFFNNLTDGANSSSANIATLQTQINELALLDATQQQPRGPDYGHQISDLQKQMAFLQQPHGPDYTARLHDLELKVALIPVNRGGTGTASAAGVLSVGTLTGSVSIASPLIQAGGSLSVAAATTAALGAVVVGGGMLVSGVGTISVPAFTRTLEFGVLGVPPASQVYQVAITQAGTLTANASGAQGHVLTNPTATWLFLLATQHSGSVTTQGTITISTGGTLTFPTFSAVALAAGDTVQITSQATPDLTGADVVIGLQYTSP